MISFIKGISLGIEYIEAIPEEEIPFCIVIDLFILRFLIEV